MNKNTCMSRPRCRPAIIRNNHGRNLKRKRCSAHLVHVAQKHQRCHRRRFRRIILCHNQPQSAHRATMLLPTPETPINSNGDPEPPRKTLPSLQRRLTIQSKRQSTPILLTSFHRNLGHHQSKKPPYFISEPHPSCIEDRMSRGTLRSIF